MSDTITRRALLKAMLAMAVAAPLAQACAPKIEEPKPTPTAAPKAEAPEPAKKKIQLSIAT